MGRLRNLGNGAAMGLADLVPGISGGTVALVLGFHPRLVAAIAAFDTRLPGDAWHAVRGDAEARDRLGRLDLGFLVPLAIGIAAVILIGSHVVEAALAAGPGLAMALFFGLLAASISIPLRHASTVAWTWFTVGALASAVVVFIPGLAGGPSNALAWLIVGSIALLAMLLPGISGAGLLVIMGAYEPAVQAIAGLDLAIIIPFGIGGLLGLAVASRGLRWLFANRPDPTWSALSGLLAGSLVRVWPWRDQAGFAQGAPAIPSIEVASILLVLTIAVGYLAVRVFDRCGHRPQTV